MGYRIAFARQSTTIATRNIAVAIEAQSGRVLSECVRSMRNTMENITVRMETDLVDEIDESAEESGVTRSEYIRETLATRSDREERIAELEQSLESARAERDDLRRQLRETTRRQREVGELAEYVEREKALQREERERREANALRRAKWWLLGYPGDENEG